MHKFAIYTVCTGHYKYGLFALINSLRYYGYSGPIIIATDQLMSELEGKENIEQKIFKTKHIFGNLKARVILDYPSESFLYLDPDIIQTSESFIASIKSLLLQYNKFIVSSEGIVAKNELRRIEWAKFCEEEKDIEQNIYYSAGLLAGNFEKDRWLLEKWDKLINKFIEPGKYFNAHPAFLLADQDILNAILQHLPAKEFISIGMPDWIGTATGINPFHPFGSQLEPMFTHATGKEKTWLLKKLPRRYPNFYDRNFYRFMHGEKLIIKHDLSLSFMHKLWFKQSKILPFYNKVRSIL